MSEVRARRNKLGRRGRDAAALPESENQVGRAWASLAELPGRPESLADARAGVSGRLAKKGK